MKIIFNMNLGKGSMDAEAIYTKDEIVNDSFLLNRDFVVNEVVCDGNKLDILSIMSTTKLEGEDYEIKSYLLPKCNESLAIRYTGYLDGNNRTWPYVKEKISEEFTFLRFETFNYPIFAKPQFQEILSYIRLVLDCKAEVIVPKDYDVLSPAQLLECKIINNKKISLYDCSNDIIGSSITFAIARYQRKQLPSGDFYYLYANEEDINYIEEIIKKANSFMNKTFGERNISSSVKYVEIPNGFGSFAPKGCVYCTTVSFTDRTEIRQFIHEFIHLGWNAKVEGLDQRIRFFDEAFTNYFTLRVIENIISKEYCESVHKRYITNYQKHIKNDSKKLVPICDFGKHEYGGLSYTIGALSLLELCDEVGQEVFDKATTEFLNKYRNQPVTLEKFCEEYTRLCNRPDLKDFFDKWIYSTQGPKKYLEVK